MTHEQFITRETENHECYVLPKTAKLAKEAGFDWNCYKVYKTDVTENLTLFTYTKEEGYRNTSEFICSAPTQAVLQRWLREIKNIHIQIMFDNSIYYVIINIKDTFYNIMRDNRIAYFYTYEAALEVAEQKCLTLIIEKQ